MKKKIWKICLFCSPRILLFALAKKNLEISQIPQCTRIQIFHNALVFQILSLTLAVKAAIARMVHQCSSFLV